MKLFKLSLLALFTGFVAFVLLAQPVTTSPGITSLQPLSTGPISNTFNTYQILTNTDWTIDGNKLVPYVTPYTNLVYFRTNNGNGITYTLQNNGITRQLIVKIADTGSLLQLVSNAIPIFTLDMDAGTILLNQQTCLFPNSAGSSGNVLQTDGSGNLSWQAVETVISNFTQNVSVSGKATFNQLIFTNGFFAKTNSWSGPTNTVDVSIYAQSYTTVTPINFSGLINRSNNLQSEVKMTVNNASSSNITATAVAGCVFANGDTSETITNGHRGIFWINYDPALGGQTNLVFQHF